MKLIIYQALTRLWGDGKMSSWDKRSLDYIKRLGADYIWYTGIPRHSTGKDFVKGNPGSPYSITDWEDVNPYLADKRSERLEEFSSLVSRTHSAGLKCIIDFIPNHVAKDYKGKLRHFDFCDYDWTDTLKNDWSVPQTLDAAVEILRFWASRGVDGFRCDMVELVPADAMKALISALKSDFPDLIFIAEVYGKEKYRKYIDYVGFDLLYDKSGSYDILRSIIRNGSGARALTWNWQWLQDLQPRMLNFLENHDEQRIASPWFAGKASNAYAALAFSLLYNNASFMLYFGQEAGENASEGHEGRTSIFNWSKPAAITQLHDFVETGKELPETAKAVFIRYKGFLEAASLPVFRKGGTWDLCYCQPSDAGFDPDRHFAFLRFTDSEAYLVVCNFSDQPMSASISIPPEVPAGEGTFQVDVPQKDAVLLNISGQVRRSH